MVPPPYLIPRVLDHMEKCKGSGVLVVPRWQSSSFWPLLHNGTNWSTGLKLIQEYANPSNFFVKGPFGNEVFTGSRFASNVLVFKLNFNIE